MLTFYLETKELKRSKISWRKATSFEVSLHCTFLKREIYRRKPPFRQKRAYERTKVLKHRYFGQFWSRGGEETNRHFLRLSKEQRRSVTEHFFRKSLLWGKKSLSPTRAGGEILRYTSINLEEEEIKQKFALSRNNRQICFVVFDFKKEKESKCRG